MTHAAQDKRVLETRLVIREPVRGRRSALMPIRVTRQRVCSARCRCVGRTCVRCHGIYAASRASCGGAISRARRAHEGFARIGKATPRARVVALDPTPACVSSFLAALSRETHTMAAAATPTFTTGQRATLDGFRSRPDLNGTVANVLAWDAGAQRYSVATETGEKIKVRETNMTLDGTPNRVVDRALFVQNGAFIQPSMTASTSESLSAPADGDAHRLALPAGQWEVRFIDQDPPRVTVTLEAVLRPTDEFSEASNELRSLSCTRTLVALVEEDAASPDLTATVQGGALEIFLPKRSTDGDAHVEDPKAASTGDVKMVDASDGVHVEVEEEANGDESDGAGGAPSDGAIESDDEQLDKENRDWAEWQGSHDWDEWLDDTLKPPTGVTRGGRARTVASLKKGAPTSHSIRSRRNAAARRRAAAAGGRCAPGDRSRAEPT
uniref:Uncharacterized protein n=1 Tax=Prymnesium polylepis TaxID=72548 RepID=A0A7S4HN21_9EUKA